MTTPTSLSVGACILLYEMIEHRRYTLIHHHECSISQDPGELALLECVIANTSNNTPAEWFYALQSPALREILKLCLQDKIHHYTDSLLHEFDNVDDDDDDIVHDFCLEDVGCSEDDDDDEDSDMDDDDIEDIDDLYTEFDDDDILSPSTADDLTRDIVRDSEIYSDAKEFSILAQEIIDLFIYQYAENMLNHCVLLKSMNELVD